MFLCKELLLSCIVMMHISFMASKPAKLGRLQANEVLKRSLPNLRQAESDYITYILNGVAPLEYKQKSLRPMKGITLPVGNTTEEIQASACAISDYLDNHLPAITRNLTLRHQDIIENTDAFHHQFKGLFSCEQLGSHENTNCHRNGSITNNYDMKPIGLQIIYSVRKWVESYLLTHTHVRAHTRATVH
ncbi:hypothetical protein PAMA_018648 [Pampus argenteus]